MTYPSNSGAIIEVYSQSMADTPRRHVVLHVKTSSYFQIFRVPSALIFRPTFMTFLTENNLDQS